MAEGKKNIAPVKLELLIIIVENGKGAFYGDLVQSLGCNFQFACHAKGTADSAMLRRLGLADYDQTAVFCVVQADKLDEITEALESRFRTIRGGKGIAFAVPFSSLIGKTVYGFLAGDERVTEGQNG